MRFSLTLLIITCFSDFSLSQVVPDTTNITIDDKTIIVIDENPEELAVDTISVNPTVKKSSKTELTHFAGIDFGFCQLIDANGVVTAQRTLTADGIQTFTFSTTETSTAPFTNVCETEFQSGGWLLVRRVRQGSVWHPATDRLLGLDVYGTYGSPTSDATFSVAFSSMVTSDTEFLFATGTCS